ncbi:primosome assembly protein PriA [Kytococcus sedentarius]|uniref:primosomal protein N' family DNA-binding protein n=1 Tax=Kytococcus sedentarius TaxID=1276 RepID=UPI0035BC0CAA
MSRSAPPGVGELAAEHPVARVLVSGTLPHLDRPFDYVVPADLDAQAVPGVRVTVPLAGRTEEGWITERLAESDHPGQLSPLRSVVSPLPVLTPALHATCVAVATHYGGTVSDVVRLAIPARHAGQEKAVLEQPAPPVEPEGAEAPRPSPAWRGVAAAAALLARIAAGEHPAASWVAAPDGGDPAAHWAHGLLDLAVAAAASGRGALLLVPDEADVERVMAVAGTRPEPVLAALAPLTASQGPRARYGRWVEVLQGHQRLVVGTRSAAFAPVRDLGLVAWWDDGDDSWREPRTPHPHTREVAAARARTEGAALVAGGHVRSARLQHWVESGFMADLAAHAGSVRSAAARVHVAGEGQDEARDAGARLARIPTAAWTAAKRALEHGPVLVQVPRTGYSGSVRCQDCGAAAECPACPGRLAQTSADTGPRCSTCGQEPTHWTCGQCGGRRWRPAAPGTDRTAHDLGRAFPGVPVVTSTAASRVAEVGRDPALVIATPGVEPHAVAGYAAALVLDGAVTLELPLSDAASEALRRWTGGTAQVRPEGPGIVLCGLPAHAGIDAVEGFLRRDPAWFARQVLTERRAAQLPPAVALVHLVGHRRDVEAAMVELSAALPASEVVGVVPVGAAALPSRWELPLEQAAQAWVRTTWEHAAELGRTVHALRAHRSARKARGELLMTVDPEEWLAP